MVDLFRGFGLEVVPGAGAPFDPEVHEAIMREESNDVEEGTVLQEFRKGFRLGDKLLRPAMVKVSTERQPYGQPMTVR
jgi:molecular chaperone GrpE